MVQILVIDAILTPGKRTVTAILRTIGLQDNTQFQNYHRLLNRAKWSGLVASKLLFGLVVVVFCGLGSKTPESSLQFRCANGG